MSPILSRSLNEPRIGAGHRHWGSAPLAARFLLGALVLVFLATRFALYWNISPIFDVDTYKYFGGADSLWAGRGWAPIFLERHEGGGALHAVPGYSLFMVAVWKVVGTRTLSGVALAQAAFSCVALLATMDLVLRRCGAGAAVAVTALLVASPSLAWLDHFLMPESLSAALFVLAMWFVARMPVERGLDRSTLTAALASGLLLSFGILLRTSSQVFVPFPPLLAIGCLRSWRAIALWGAVYAAALAVPLLPWILHNQRVHGHPVISASTGRSLYFSGVWSNTIDRETQMQKLGPGRPTDVMSSFYLLDAQFQRFLDSGMDIVEADAAMRRLALGEYRAAGIERYARGRMETLVGLFQRESFGRRNNVLIDMMSWYLAEGSASAPIRGNMERRWAYEFTPEAAMLVDDTRRTHSGSGLWFRRWVERMSFDGMSLALAFVASTCLLLARPRSHGFALRCWVLPVCAYLAMYTIFGNPLYRYQAVIHGPMLTVIGLAFWQLVQLARGAVASVGAGSSPTVDPPA